MDLEKQIAAAKVLKDKTDTEFKSLKVESTNKELLEFLLESFFDDTLYLDIAKLFIFLFLLSLFIFDINF